MFSAQQYSGFDPRTVPGCALWLDAADSNAFTFSSGNNIATWKDKSQSALTGIALNSPTLVANSINGLPSVQFNGTSQYFNFGNNLNYGSNSIYVFSVVQYDSTADGQIIGKYATTGNSGSWLVGRITNTMYFIVYRLNGANLRSYADSSLTPQLITGYWDRTNIQILQNGGLKSTIAYTDTRSDTTTYSLFVGVQQGSTGTAPDSRYFPGKMCEIIVYIGSAISPTERQSIEGYLAWKWGLNSLLPTVHPFKPNRITTRVFQPIDISGCSLWLDAADSSTFTFSSGSNISTWRDKSPNSLVGTATSSPTLTSNAQKGLSAISFVASSSQYIDYTGTSLLPGSNQIYMFAVAKINNTSAGILSRDLYVIGSYGLFRENDALYSYVTGQSGSPVAAGGFNDTTNTQLIVGTWNRSVVRLFINGADGGFASSTDTGTLNGSGLLRIGSMLNTGYHLDGQIMEIIVYFSNLTTFQRQQLEGYLAAKWGLSASLPTTQPFYLQRALPSTPLFTPTALSGVALWLDGLDPNGNGTLPANNAALSTWVDKSGAGNSGTASGTTPLYQSSGGVLFSDGAYLTNYSASLANESLFFVYTPTISVASITLAGPSGNGGRTLLVNTNRRLESSSYFVAFGSLTPDGVVTLNQRCQSGYINTASSMFVTHNGVTYSPVSLSFTVGHTTRIGAAGSTLTQFFKGTIHEVIGYNVALTTSQRQQVEGYLAWKWGVQNSLPITHPYYKFRP